MRNGYYLPVTIVLMGVSGSGKTTVGTALATELGWKFIDGDDLHPAENVAKMARGIPLDDVDRAPWLLAVRNVIQEQEASSHDIVVACSALKQRYRDFLAEGTHIRWVFLAGSAAVIRARLVHRTGHFMKSVLLDSQLESLEIPGDALMVEIRSPVPDTVRSIRRGLGI